MNNSTLDQEYQEIAKAVIGKRIVSISIAQHDDMLNLESITLEDGTVIETGATDWGNIVTVNIK